MPRERAIDLFLARSRCCCRVGRHLRGGAAVVAHIVSKQAHCVVPLPADLHFGWESQIFALRFLYFFLAFFFLLPLLYSLPTLGDARPSA